MPFTVFTWEVHVATDPLLRIRDLHVYYGSSHVLHGVDLDLDLTVMGMLGRNGMGKTTLCAAIMGLAPVSGGKIEFDGHDITNATPEARARLGIGYVPQGRRIFRSLTVEEHLKMMWRKGGSWTIDRVYETFPRLKERRRNLGDRLSGGEQQMLAIARALMLDPKLLVLDEPTEGLAPAIVSDVIDLIAQVTADGIGVLLVEQNIHAALTAAQNVAIMVNGVIVEALPAAVLEGDTDLQKRHLGIEPSQTVTKGEVS